VNCRAKCKQSFAVNEEKQTDINIAVAMVEFADKYDKLILMTADSDQVPALKLIKEATSCEDAGDFAPHRKGSQRVVAGL